MLAVALPRLRRRPGRGGKARRCRLQVSRISHGSPDGLLGSCDTYTPGQPVPGQATIDRQDGKPVRLNLRLQAPQADPAAYAKRTASWTVALYAEHK